jgi:hypothetical protein
VNATQLIGVGTAWQGCILASHPNRLNYDCTVIWKQGYSRLSLVKTWKDIYAEEKQSPAERFLESKGSAAGIPIERTIGELDQS